MSIFPTDDPHTIIAFDLTSIEVALVAFLLFAVFGWLFARQFRALINLITVGSLRHPEANVRKPPHHDSVSIVRFADLVEIRIEKALRSFSINATSAVGTNTYGLNMTSPTIVALREIFKINAYLKNKENVKTSTPDP